VPSSLVALGDESRRAARGEDRIDHRIQLTRAALRIAAGEQANQR